MRFGDVEAEACVRGEALGVHAIEDGDASVDAVVELDAMLSLMGAEESSDVLDDSALERQREGEEQRVELGPVEAFPSAVTHMVSASGRPSSPLLPTNDALDQMDRVPDRHFGAMCRVDTPGVLDYM